MRSIRQIYYAPDLQARVITTAKCFVVRRPVTIDALDEF